MRLLLAELACALGDIDRNLERLADAIRAAPSDLAIFPELFLSGYRVGDRMHRIALHLHRAPRQLIHRHQHAA